MTTSFDAVRADSARANQLTSHVSMANASHRKRPRVFISPPRRCANIPAGARRCACGEIAEAISTRLRYCSSWRRDVGGADAATRIVVSRRGYITTNGASKSICNCRFSRLLHSRRCRPIVNVWPSSGERGRLAPRDIVPVDTLPERWSGFRSIVGESEHSRHEVSDRDTHLEVVSSA